MNKEEYIVIKIILFALKQLSGTQRERVFDEVGDKFCLNCGSIDGRKSYCRRDD